MYCLLLAIELTIPAWLCLTLLVNIKPIVLVLRKLVQ